MDYNVFRSLLNYKGEREMQETLEKLWFEYLIEKCAVIDTDEERKLTQEVAELHEKANALMNYEQQMAVEKYIDALGDLECLFAKKAFCRGCEFGVSFLLETRNLKINLESGNKKCYTE